MPGDDYSGCKRPFFIGLAGLVVIFMTVIVCAVYYPNAPEAVSITLLVVLSAYLIGWFAWMLYAPTPTYTPIIPVANV